MGSNMGGGEGIQVTNDGATILKSIQLDNPAAKVLVGTAFPFTSGYSVTLSEISKGIDDEVGDGTTSVCVLAGELLREAERLLQSKIHPQTVIEGWRLAVAAALHALEACSFDDSTNPGIFT